MENAGAAAVKLTSEEIAAITKIAQEADIPGERYPAQMLKTVNVQSPVLAE